MVEFDRCVVIEALAGAGKTYKLSHRYLQLVHMGFDPTSILATTFSNKASGEIRDRIIATAADAVIDTESRLQLCKGIGINEDLESCVSILRKIVLNLHKLQIGTIDSFFVKTAKAFSDQIGFPSGWSILDELQEDTVMREAVADLLVSYKQPISDFAALMKLASGSSNPPILETITKIRKFAYELIRQTDASAWNCEEKLQTLSSNELDLAIADLELQNSEKKTHNSALHGTEKRQGDIDRANSGDWMKFLQSGLARPIMNETFVFGGGNDNAIEQHIIEAFEPIIAHASATIVNKLIDKNTGIHKLMTFFNASWSKIKYEKALYSFDDITHYLGSIAMGMDELVFADLQEVAFRLDCTIDHLLIDEFQDTSFTQWNNIVKLLVDEIHQSEEERSLFFVGDPKQSLYGFRGGEPQLLRELPAYLGMEEPERLPKSWRCAPAVLDCVNKVFEGTLGAELLLEQSSEGLEEWHKSFSPHVSANENTLGHASIHTTKVDEDRKPNLHYMVQKVVEIVKDIHTKAPGATIGVLVKENQKQQIQRIVHALRTDKEHSVLAAEHKGNPLTDSVPVTIILSVLILIDHPKDKAALFHISTSPLAEYLELEPTVNPKDALSLCRELRECLLRDGYAQVVSDLATPLLACSSERDQMRLWQLIELAEQYESCSTLRTTDFVSYIKKKKVSDPASSKVQVMTVHASKGLGFDAVIACDLDKRLWKNPDMLTEHENICEPPKKVSVYLSEEYNAIVPWQIPMWEERKSKSVQEALSVLYVAMTRAKYALYLVVPPRPKNESAKSYSKPTSKSIDRLIRQTLELDEHLLPDTVVWESPQNNEHWYQQIDVDPEEASGSKDIPITWKESNQGTRGVVTTSPSKLEGGGKVSVSTQFACDTNIGFSWGTVVHSWFEKIEWLDNSTPSIESLMASAPKNEAAILGEKQLRAAAQSFLDALGSDSIAKLLTKPDEIVTVFNEQTFALRVEKGTEFASVKLKEVTDLQGSIDRLVVYCDEEGTPKRAEVIDWKTDAFDEDKRAGKIEHYAPQLASYRLAASKLLGLDKDQITTSLVFVKNQEIVQIGEKSTSTL